MRHATKPLERSYREKPDRAGKDLVRRVKHYESAQAHPNIHIFN